MLYLSESGGLLAIEWIGSFALHLPSAPIDSRSAADSHPDVQRGRAAEVTLSQLQRDADRR